MATIEIDKKTPFLIGATFVEKLIVKSVGFTAYAKGRLEASARAKNNQEAARLDMRARMKMQSVGITADGTEVRLTDEAITQMPFRAGRQLLEALDLVLFVGVEGQPEVLAKGNGLDTPIHIKLGTPIKAAAGGQDIEELEFQASTVGQLEDVMVAGGDYERTVAILAIAKPVGGSLMMMPTWGVDGISVSDGLFIMKHVTNTFFDQPDNS